MATNRYRELDVDTLINMLASDPGAGAMRAFVARIMGAEPGLRHDIERGRPNVEHLLFKVEDAAAALALSRAKTFELIARGEIETVKIGRSRRVTRRALEQFIERAAEGTR